MSAGDRIENELMRLASAGDRSAAGALLEKHRARLHQMVSFRLDERLLARVDASDVVQEAMIEASRRLADYLHQPPVPLYVWLRQIACDRLAKAYRRHVVAQKRSVDRELRDGPALSDESSKRLADCLIASGTSPSGKLMRQERHHRVRMALAALKEADRDVLVLRHLEKLSTSEVAAILGISETAAKSRHFRAILRLQTLLGEDSTVD